MPEPIEKVASEAPKLPSILTRAAQAVAYTIAGVRPDTWFGPMQPLAPMAPPGVKGRAFDYLFGWNLQYIPRGTEPVDFATLRYVADRCDLLRLLLETRKDRVSVLDWEVRPKKIAKGKKAAGPNVQTQVDEVTAMLRSPDRRLQWGQWVREVLDQNLVYDAVSVFRRKTRAGRPFSWELIDGATIKVLLDADGRTPLPPSPAYQQVIKGIPASDYSSWSTGDMLYFPENPRVDRGYGFSRVEQCLRYIQVQIARLDSQLGWYQEGNVPEGFIEAPQEMTLDQIRSMQDIWDSIFAGLQALKQRRKVWWVPSGSKYTAMKEATLKGDIDEWIARCLCFAMSEDPTPFVKQQNRATAESAQAKAEAEGLLPSMLYIKRLVNALIEMDFGYTEIEFAWSLDTEFDPAKKMMIDTGYAKAGIKSIDEVRESIGEETLGGAFARPMAYTATGYVAIDANVDENGKAIPKPVPVPVAPGADPAVPAGKDKDGKGGGAAASRKTPPKGGESASGGSGSGKGKTEKAVSSAPAEITRSVLNAHSVADWLGGLRIDGEKLAAEDLRVEVGKLDSSDLAGEQPGALIIDAGKREVGNLLDGRLALFFESPDLAARGVELGSFERSCIPLTRGAAVLVEAGEAIEKAGETGGLDAGTLRAGAAAAAAGGDLEKAKDYGLLLHRLHERRAETCEPDCRFCGGEEAVEKAAGGVAPYAGMLLLGAEEHDGVAKASPEEIAAAAATADPDPTEGRLRAGNYRKGHFRHRGVGFTIENDAGSKRRGVDRDGEPWEVTMPVPYGDADRSMGADGDKVDVYFGPNPEAETVWVVDQVDAATGEFDEHKCFVFFDSWAEAQSAYLAAFSDGRAHERLGHVSSMSFDEFRDWLKEPQIEPRSMVEKAGGDDEARDGHGRWTSGGGGEPHKPGDKIRVQEARTAGGRSHDIVVREHLKGNKYRGEVISGPSVGMTVVGDKIGPARGEKSVTVGTGLHGHDLRGARRPRKGQRRFEKVVQWRNF